MSVLFSLVNDQYLKQCLAHKTFSGSEVYYVMLQHSLAYSHYYKALSHMDDIQIQVFVITKLSPFHYVKS